MNTPKHKLGISLSGGGYRAAAYHLGTLKKLHEMNVLPKVEVISTISGGSIAGAFYGLRKDNYQAFEDELYKGLQEKDVLKFIFSSWIFFRTLLFALVFLVPAFWSLFSPLPWLFPVIIGVFLVLLLKYQFYIFAVSEAIEKAYALFFFNKTGLKDLPASPVLVIGSTNLQTARPFTFSKDWMQDSTYQYLKDGQGNPLPVNFNGAEFPLARAVMASSCVPGAFTPIRISRKFFSNPDRDFSRVNPQLVDGGVFDNQGIHKIMVAGQYECSTVITSDAGNQLSQKGNFNNLVSLLSRCMNIFMTRIKNAQLVNDIYENTELGSKEIAFLSLGWDVENCIPGFIQNLAGKKITAQVIKAHQLKDEWVAQPLAHAAEIQAWLEQTTGYQAIPKPTIDEVNIARTVSTNLKALSKPQVDCLMKQAAAICEIQVKLYCPSIL